MAAARLDSISDVETRFNEDDYAAWKRCFSPAQRQQLIDDDLFAARSVPLVLAAIVGVGVILAILSVWLTG